MYVGLTNPTNSTQTYFISHESALAVDYVSNITLQPNQKALHAIFISVNETAGTHDVLLKVDSYKHFEDTLRVKIINLNTPGFVGALLDLFF